MDDVKNQAPMAKLPVGRVYGRRAIPKSTKARCENANIFRASVNCLAPEPVRQAFPCEIATENQNSTGPREPPSAPSGGAKQAPGRPGGDARVPPTTR